MKHYKLLHRGISRRLTPAVLTFVEVRSDSSELGQLVLFQLLRERDRIEVVECVYRCP